MWRDERSIFNQQIYLLYWGNWRRGRPSMAGNLLKRHLKLLECDRIWEKPVYFVSTHLRLKIITVPWKKTKDIARLDSCLSFTPTIRADEKTPFKVPSVQLLSIPCLADHSEAEASISEIISERLWVQLDTHNKIPGHKKAKNIINVTNGQW